MQKKTTRIFGGVLSSSNASVHGLRAREMRGARGDDFSFCVLPQLCPPSTEDPINLPAIKFVN